MNHPDTHKMEQHRQNVAREMAKQSTVEGRAEVSLKGVISATRAMIRDYANEKDPKKILDKAKAEVDFMESHLSEQMQGIKHGVTAQ